MKKITQLLLIAGLILAGQCFVYGQSGKIALQHNGGLTLYTDLTLAMAGAVDGDTLYLPGGTVYVSGNAWFYINKRLTIIGAGHNPDSTSATYKTVVPVPVYIVTGADNGSLTGIQCDGLSFGSTNSDENINNYKIERCKIERLYPSIDNVSTSSNIIISENVITMLVFSTYQGNLGFLSVLFEKNIFGPDSYYIKDALFNNNIFYNNSEIDDCVFEYRQCNGVLTEHTITAVAHSFFTCGIWDSINVLSGSLTVVYSDIC